MYKHLISKYINSSRDLFINQCIFNHFIMIIGVAPITQLPTCVIKIVTFKGGHLMWQNEFHANRNCSERKEFAPPGKGCGFEPHRQDT